MLGNYIKSIGSTNVLFYTTASLFEQDATYGDKVVKIFDCITKACHKKSFDTSMYYCKRQLRLKLKNTDVYPYTQIYQIGEGVYKVTAND